VVAYGLLGALLAFGLGYAVAVLLLFPAPADAAPGIVVPRLLGQDSAWAERALAARGLRLGTVTALPDPAAAAGQIVAQDALPGQQLRRGALVHVAVSSGAARATLPNVTGYTASRATALLSALGFQPTQQVVPGDLPAGRVVGISPAPGLEYDLPARVLLTVSAGPPAPDTMPRADSAAADTLPPAAAPPPPARGTPPAESARTVRR
jgi:serine/threonine-protein kinase